METLADSRLVILHSDGNDGIKYWPIKEAKEVSVGCDLTCDIRLKQEGIKDRHFTIYINSLGKIKIMNLCSERPILVNDETIDGKKILKSGDVIDLLGNKMRWESAAAAKRRFSMLSKAERKASRCMKTRRRITVHQLKSMQKSQVSIASPQLKTPIKREQQKQDSPMFTPTLRNKENVSDSLHVNTLNLSGTLLTSYTPSTMSRRSASSSKTVECSNAPPSIPSDTQDLNTEVSAQEFSSPVKSALGETSTNHGRFETPNMKIKKSMYLIDLTTPAVNKFKSSSTPDQSPSKRTPTKSTLSHNENNLLKSAIKNSAFKKKVGETSNRKVLVYSNALNESPADSIKSCDSSVIELGSFTESPVMEINESLRELHATDTANANETVEFEGLSTLLKTPIKDQNVNFSNYTGIGDLLQTPERELDIDQTSEDEVRQLIDSISSVLDENDVANVSDESLDKAGQAKPASSKCLDVERNFERVFERNKSTEMESVEKQFDTLIGRPSISRTYSAKKATPDETVQYEDDDVDEQRVREKGPIILKWIEGARESLANESNNTEQVLSSRYSNITPNDSIVGQQDETPKRYDATTPKVSILQTFEHFRKSSGGNKLTMSPVTRLSLLENSTEVIENYHKINNAKSMRSTRKHIGNAIASMNNLSNVADTTFDANESLNFSMENPQQDINQTLVEDETDILLLDGPGPSQTVESSEQQNAFYQNLISSNNFIEFANDDDIEISLKEIFEISSNENSQNENEESQSGVGENSESEESEYSDDEDDETRDDLCLPEAPLKFRLSGFDLEEGINPLEDSRTEEDEIVDSTDTTAIKDEEKVSNLTAKIDESSVVSEISSEIILSSKTTDQPEIELKSNQTLEHDSEIYNESIEVEELDETASINQTTFADDKEDYFEIPATQAMEEDIVQSSELQDEPENMNDDQFEIPATQDDKLQLGEESFIFDKNSADTTEASDNKTFQSIDENQSLMFSDTEFSRVEIEMKLDDLESDELPNRDEINDELAGISDKPNVNKRAASLLQCITKEKDVQRKTMAVPVDGTLTDAFVTHIQIQKELVNVANKAESSKRGVTLMPQEIVKISGLKKRISQDALNSDDLLSPAFVEHIEIQQELVNVADKAESSKRGVTLMPQEIVKIAGLKKRISQDGLNSDDLLSPAFVEHIEIQQELVNVKSIPDPLKRGISLLPDQIANVTTCEETSIADELNKHGKTRQTIGISLPQHNLSESFVDLVERRKEMVNLQDQPNIEKRASSLTPEKDIKSDVARKTMAPQLGELSESFVQFVEAQKQTTEDPSVVETNTSLVLQLTEEVPETKENEKTDEDDKPEPATAEVLINNSFELPAENAKTEIHESDESNDKQPIVEVCIKKTAYVTTIEDQPTNVAETPSKRRAARIDYSQLASGATPRKLGTPAKTETPRRGRSASIDSIILDEKKSETKAKRTRRVMTAVEPDITEEQDDQVDVKICSTAEIVKVYDPIEVDIENSTVTKANENSEEQTVDKVSAELNKPEPNELVPETSSKRRIQKIDYSQLVSGATPKKLATPKKTELTRRKRSVSIDSVNSMKSTNEIKVKRARRVKKAAVDVDTKEQHVDVIVQIEFKAELIKEPIEDKSESIVEKTEIRKKIVEKNTVAKNAKAPKQRAPRKKLAEADNEIPYEDKTIEETKAPKTKKRESTGDETAATKTSKSKNEVQTVSQEDSMTAAPPVKKSRQAKVVEKSTIELVVEETKTNRRQKAEIKKPENASPVLVRTRKNNKKQIENPASVEQATTTLLPEKEIADAVKQPKGRRGKKLVVDIETIEAPIPETASKSSSSRSSKMNDSVKPDESIKPRRDVKLAHVMEVSVEDSVTPRRGTRAASKVQELSSIMSTAKSSRSLRGNSRIKTPSPKAAAPVRKGRGKQIIMSPEQQPTEEKAVETTKTKKETKTSTKRKAEIEVAESSTQVASKSRRAAVKEAKAEEPQQSVGTLPVPTKKTRRGAAKEAKNEPEMETETAPVPVVEKTAKEVPVEIVVTRKRGRKPVEVEPSPSAAVAPIAKATPVKRGGSKRQVKIVTPPTVAVAKIHQKSEEPKATLSQAPVTKRSTRSRK